MPAKSRALRVTRTASWGLEEVREILRNAVRAENQPRASLGSRLAARFAGIGLTDDIPELRGHPARPADFRP